MAPKKKNNKNTKQTKKEDDFDLDAFLEEEGLADKPPAPQEAPKAEEAKEEPKEEPKPIQIEDFSNVEDAAAAFLNSLGGQPSTGGKKKNKKKKSAAASAAATTEAGAGKPAAGEGGKKGKKEPEPPKLSAAAKRILAERERRQKEEEERRRIEEEERKKQEEEERKRREEEEAIARRKAAKKERERELREQRKRDGTYKTAWQKQKEAEDRVKVEMMRKLMQQQQEQKERERKEREERKREEEERKEKEEEAAKEAAEEEVLEDWENEEVVDDWENESVSENEVKPAEVPDVQEKKQEEKKEEKKEEKPKLSKKEQRELERREKEEAKRAKEEEAAREQKKMADLRSPICVIMGHVDTGKTSLLDKIRHTSVQENEAGGITQQIGATYFPINNIKQATEKVSKDLNLKYMVPGLLVIDTPGHESFSNLRSRGSNLCDLAILVVDIMHLLEPQTIESLNMLRSRRCPFVVALNKVDRLYDWKSRPNAPFRDSLKLQPGYTQEEFRNRVNQTITAFMSQGLNAALYYENPDPKNVISLVPTSAVSGEGIPDLLGLLIKLSQDYMVNRLTLTEEVKATVLEKKVMEGLGTSLDVILVNGRLRVGDTIVLCGMNGPVTTTIRALLTPQPMRELRTRTMYQKHDEIRAAMGLKIAAQNLEDAIAGTSLLVCRNEEELPELQEHAQDELESVRRLLKVDGEGVYVQTSTLGSLEALLEFLSSLDPPIPVGSFNIGPIHKRDVIQASIMLERKKEFATILAFDVKIDPDAAHLAKELGVRIFSADIIYHLFDQFTAYIKSLEDEKREASREEAIFPCRLQIIPQYIFNRSNPIVVGVDVLEGILRPGTPLCVVQKKTTEVVQKKKTKLEDWMPDSDEDVNLSFKESKKSRGLGESVETVETTSYVSVGIVKSIKADDKDIAEARPGKAVSISIEPKDSSKAPLLGRTFQPSEVMLSHLTRRSIDSLKENFKDYLNDDEWRLVIKLKGILNIQ